MAKVELDISEYELMKDKARLLEESLAREQKLNDENKALQQQNIDTLKANEKSVTIVNKKHISTMIVRKRSPGDIRRHLKIKMEQTVRTIVDQINRGLSGSNSHRSSMFMDHHDHFGIPNHMRPLRFHGELESIVEHAMRECDFDPDQLHALFYDEEKTQSSYEPESITMKGLDQVKSDMYDKALDKLKSKSRDALSLNPVLEKEIRDLKSEVKGVESDLKKAEKRLKLSQTLDEKKNEEILEAKNQHAICEYNRSSENEKFREISLVVSEKITTFGNKKKVNQIKQIIERKDER